MRTLRVLHLLLSVLQVAAYQPLSDASLQALPSPGSDYDIRSGSLLAPILRVRKPGTPEIEQVRNHFVSFFRSHLPLWNIAFQNSTQPTALGRNIQFVNLIITRDPPWSSSANVGRLTFAAHYDSKVTPEGFIGAIDSAVPCAVMMHMARSLDAALSKKWADMQARKDPLMNWEKGVQMIFFDGEEAFVSWSDDDSLYGSRALAAEMESAIHPALSMFKNNLDSIELFVLLDLLGSANPNVPSYFITTHWAYESMAAVESRLRKLKLLKTSPRNMQGQGMFLVDHNMCSVHGCDEDDFAQRGSIADDHLPFMARGVQILHMIPSPFPDVWHEITDDGEHLDLPTVDDWSMIFTGFAAEYLELEGHIPPSVPHKRDSLEESDWSWQEIHNRDEL